MSENTTYANKAAKQTGDRKVLEGTWDPSIEAEQSAFIIDQQRLKQYVTLSQKNLLEELDTQLSSDEKQSQAPLMQQNREAWLSAGASLPDESIIHLIRFFTLAEQLPGWDAANKSPVIALAKILKQRGSGIDKELLIWIKANSRNQFLPHGSLL